MCSYTRQSDIDLCVTGAPPGPQSLITLAEVLHAKELSTQLHVISSAKVPIIKLTDKVSGSIVDIRYFSFTFILLTLY